MQRAYAGMLEQMAGKTFTVINIAGAFGDQWLVYGDETSTPAKESSWQSYGYYFPQG